MTARSVENMRNIRENLSVMRAFSLSSGIVFSILAAAMPGAAISSDADAASSARYLVEIVKSTNPKHVDIFTFDWTLPVKINGDDFNLRVGEVISTEPDCYLDEVVPAVGRFYTTDAKCDGVLDELIVRMQSESAKRSVDLTDSLRAQFSEDLRYIAQSIAALSLATPALLSTDAFTFPDPLQIAEPANNDLDALFETSIPILQAQPTVAEGKYHFFWIEIDEGYKFQRLATSEMTDGRPSYCMDMIITPELRRDGIERLQFDAPNCRIDGSAFYKLTQKDGFQEIDLTEEESANWITGFARALHLWNERDARKLKRR